MEDYRGKIALVTGASSGLGPHIAMELARAGCDVAVTARRTAILNDVALRIENETGRTVIAVPGDLTMNDDRLGILDQVERQLGSVDILANVAGVARGTRFVDEDPSRVLATNLEAPIQLTRLVVEGMIRRGFGRVLNVASLAAHGGLPYVVDYSAAKAGLVAFSLGLREELRRSGVSLTVVSPGFIADEGMYVPYQTPIPWYLGSNRSTAVARKAVKALRRKRAQVILNRIPMKPLILLGTVSDGAMRSMSRTLGSTAFLRGLADKRLPYSDSPELQTERSAA